MVFGCGKWVIYSCATYLLTLTGMLSLVNAGAKVSI
jgi:hypothetical protein